ncbi:DUF2070 family protein [Candidatus Bathyarchaeota archaeon]|nr:DUF2070 family protein [Candidatus Bathyarchaeota archaeon]
MAKEEYDYLSRATRHYSSLFTFPSYPVLLTYMVGVVIIVSLATFMMVSITLENLLKAVMFGLEVFILPAISADFLTSWLFKDILMNLRRLAALSTVTTIVWVLLIAVGTLLQTKNGVSSVVPTIFLGGSLLIGFRYLVVKSVGSFSTLGNMVAVLLPSSMGLTVAALFWYPIPNIIVLSTAISSSLTIVAGELFLRMMNEHGVTSVGIRTLRLFHGFISDWLEGIASPLEDIFEDMSVPADASVCLLRFAQSSEIQGLIVVSDIHPGPFKNVGSSNIPFEIQSALEYEIKSPVIVPHGASGHERDLVAEKYCRRLIDSIAGAHEFGNISGTSSCMVRCDSGDAHASCQFLGDVALVTLTCAPQSMEDIPFEIGTAIVEKGKASGAKDVVVIDAHNSVGNANEVPILSHEQLFDLKSAAESAIKSAVKLKRSSFRFGASYITPKEFKIEEGFGPGGISVAVVEVNNQKVAYVTVDGNNVVKGLREEIRNILRGMVDESEVLATDTHIVNALSITQRGYHPVGEVGNREVLLTYVKECVLKAVSRLQESTVSFNRIDVPELRVIGEEKLKSLSILIDSSVRLFKRLTLLIYVPTIVLAFILFLIL